MKETKKHTSTRVRYALLLALFISGIFIGSIGVVSVQKYKQKQLTEKYSLLADRILQNSDKDRTVNFSNLRAELASYIESSELKDANYSIYFEYLPTGTSVGFKESNPLIGASLLKVPFAVQYYRALERGEVNKTDIVTLKKENLDSEYGTLYQKGEGYKLTLDELVRIMIVDSDNTALNTLAGVLIEKANINSVDAIFNFVDINYSSTKDGATAIGAESYSSILKCLYFSCYVSKENSQEILSMLTQSTFNNRLKRYISEDEMPLIAHKIGSFPDTQSDCGIFYEPKKPYVLCVMVAGSEEFADIQIGKISVIVHEYVKNSIE